MGSEIETLTEQTLLENYDRYYRLAYQYVKNENDALDMVQESAYRAYRDCRKVREPAYLNTWIYRIVINTCLDHLRKVSREIPLESIEEPGYEETSYGQSEQPELLSILDTLKESEREIVILRFFEELKLDEISRVTGENVNTVKARLYRALKKMKIEMELGYVT